MKRITVNGIRYQYSVGPEYTIVFGPDFVVRSPNKSTVGESLEGVARRLRDKKLRPFIAKIVESCAPEVVANRQLANCRRRKQKKVDKACTYKKVFFSDLEAQQEVKKGRTKGYLKHSARTYKCPYCPGFHVTNKGRAQ